MTPLTNTRSDAVSPSDLPASETPEAGPSLRRRWAFAVGVWLLLAAFVVLVQLGRRSPSAYLDELVFGRVAENIGRGEGKTFQGLPSGMPSIYPYVIAPAWALLDGTGAYRLALALNALMMTSVVLPAYGIAATIAPYRRALLAGACAALLPAMVWSGMLMTEALAYPLAAWALWAMVRALRRPTLVRMGVVGVFVVLAYLARTQLVVLGGVFVAAVVIDVVRKGRGGLPDQLRRHRSTFTVAAVAAVGLIALLVVGQRSFGTYSCVVAEPPSIGEIASPLSNYVGTMFVATLGLPLIALAAISLRRANWRDDRLAPVLAVGLAAAAAFLVEASWTAVTVSPELQERYVFYPAPVLLALLAVLPGRASLRTTSALAFALTLYAVIVFPGFADVTGEVVAARLGLPQVAADVLGSRPFLWGAIFAVLGLAAVLAVRLGGGRGAAVALGVSALFGAATFGVRQLDANRSSVAVAAALPAPLDLIDQTTGGEPAGIVVSRDSSSAALFGLQMWNRHADRTYRLGIADAYGAGQLCPLEVARTGAMSLLKQCAGRDLPRWLLFLDAEKPLPLDNGAVRYDNNGMRLVEYRAGETPRLHLSRPDAAIALSAPETVPGDPNAPLRRCTAQ